MGKAFEAYQARKEMRKKIFAIAQKCKCTTYPEWAGYLRPDEIVDLMESGYATIDKFHQHMVERAKEDKANGVCNPVWFYFYPKREFLQMKSLKKSRCY